MELIKTIILNNKKINEFTAKEEQAQAELINILIDKVKNRYKIKIQFDNIHNSIKATLIFNHILNDGTINKYKYLYNFENIPSNINLL